MDLPRPRTYNELMLYTRCMEFRNMLEGVDGELFQKIYDFLMEDPNHRVVAEGGNLTFCTSEEEINRFPIGLFGLYSRVVLTTNALHKVLPPSMSAGSHSSGGSSGNNNNNNNNNNNS